MKRIEMIIHVGLPKTLTTLLQKILSENSEKFLLKNNILYPETFAAFQGLNNRNHWYFCKLFKNKIKIQWLHELTKNIDQQELLKNFKLELKEKKNVNKIIISCEGLVFATKNDLINIQKIFENYKIKIILVLRKQDELIYAYYNQLVKSRNLTINFNKFCEQLINYKNEKKNYTYELNKILNFESIISKYINVFGKKNLKVLFFEEEKKILVQKFFNYIGIQKFNYSMQIENSSLSPFLILIKRFTNIFINNEKKRIFFQNIFLFLSEFFPKNYNKNFSNERLLDYFFDDNIKLFDKYNFTNNPEIKKNYFKNQSL